MLFSKKMPFEIPIKCLVMIPQKTGNSDDILTKFYEIPRLLYLLKPLGVIFQWVQLLIEPHGARQGVKFIEISRTISVRDIRTTISWVKIRKLLIFTINLILFVDRITVFNVSKEWNLISYCFRILVSNMLAYF